MAGQKINRIILVLATMLVAHITFDGIYFTREAKYSISNYATVSATSTSSISTSSKINLPPESPISYTDNKNGTITDNYTGLVWKKCPQGFSGSDCKSGSVALRELSKAQVDCEKMNFAGRTGWRIPTLKELESIVDTGLFDPAINKKYFVGTDDPYWTSTSPAEYDTSSFTVLFSDGSVYYAGNNTPAATRCVHDPLI